MRAEDFGIPMRRTCRCVGDYCSHHQAIRAMWLPYVANGKVDCWRCGNKIAPTEPWDLGHDDHDRRRYRGPEHWACNRATSGRRKQRERRWIL